MDKLLDLQSPHLQIRADESNCTPFRELSVGIKRLNMKHSEKRLPSKYRTRVAVVMMWLPWTIAPRPCNILTGTIDYKFKR